MNSNFNLVHVANDEDGESQIRFHEANIEWARGVLAAPAVTYENGRNSHEAASTVMHESYDALLDYAGLQVAA